MKLNKINIWQGVVIDREKDRILYKSRPCNTWEEAQHRADKAAKRGGYGDRCKILTV